MVVIIDQVAEGHIQWIETDPALCDTVHHPDGSGLCGIDQVLLHHNNHPADREIGGWHVLSQLPGEPEPITRWQRLVRACNHPDATDQAKALGLHE
jgi:hypothetical protein